MLYMRKDPIPFFSRSRNAPIFFNLFFLRLLYVLHFFFSTITASSSSWSLAMFLQRFCYFLLISLFILLLRLFTYSACSVCVSEYDLVCARSKLYFIRMMYLPILFRNFVSCCLISTSFSLLYILTKAFFRSLHTELDCSMQISYKRCMLLLCK